MKQPYDAAIIGAGIAGNAIAKSLADYGWTTILLERKSFPRHKVCGEFLSPESLSMLKALGVHDKIMSLQPSLIDRTRLVFSHGNTVDIPFTGTAMGVSRYSLDEALLQSAQRAGVHTLTSTIVTSVMAGYDGVYVVETMKGRETAAYEARVVIAACGANGLSALMHACPNPASQRPERQAVQHTYIGVKSHFSGIEMEPVVELYFFEGGYLGISPIENGLVNVAALLNRKAFHNHKPPKTVQEWIEAACNRNEKLRQRLANAVFVPGTQVAVAPVDLKSKPSAWGLFPHVGDAALMIPPLCGDGMSMALRSAQLCAPLADRYLKGDISLSTWQAQYTKAIRQQFTGPRRWGGIVQRLIGVPFLSSILPHTIRYTPRLASKLVQVTRLQDNDG